MNTSNDILHCFLDGKFERMSCPQCDNTFLTNVYQMKCFETDQRLEMKCQTCKKHYLTDLQTAAWHEYVLLEKYALGLEYFNDAIQQHQLSHVPFIKRIGILDEDDQTLSPDVVQLFSHEEPDYRLIYIMERLEHLDEADAQFFTDYVYGMDWKDEATRRQIIQWIAERYGQPLAEDVRKLCRYFRKHEEFLAWDLHGDNLMRRKSDGVIVVMDPYALKV